MNKSTIVCSLLVWGLAACSQDDEAPRSPSMPPTSTEVTEERLLTVEVTENPFGDNASAKERGTRGTEITTTSLSHFSMQGGGKTYSLSKGGTGWSATPNLWPDVDNEEPVSFYAYNAGDFDSSDNYISFTVNENASTQTDLLVAKRENITYKATGGKVSLTFDHACAAVNIRVKRTEEVGADLAVTSIKLEGVANEGDYYYNSGWKDLSGSATYTLSNANISVTTSEQTMTCGTLFMIPQTLGSDAKVVFRNGTTVKATVPLNGAVWEPGRRYTMIIQVGTANIATP